MKILIVIPVRGNSKGIPRKNIRLMNGVPLLVYSIKTALSLQTDYNVDVVVDTDDEEIAEVAEQYGAKIVMRPEELASDNVTLDPVVYHAVQECEKENGIRYDIIITMQATSPTLRIITLKNAIQMFISDDIDTMISAVNEAHLSWCYKNDKLVPDYKERVNRQQLPPHLKETGGFLISRRSCVTETSRIGQKVMAVEIPEKESIDIDSVFDWKLCEVILKSKKILFRVDGEENLGMGHIYRCLSIAYRLTEHEILFVTKRQCKLGVKKLQESFFPIKMIDENKELFSILDEFQPDIIVNDILDTNLEYVSELRKKVSRIVNFEDRGEGAAYADCVINALYPERKSRNVYNGFQYFFIRDEFLTAKPKKFSEEVKNIVILFGGSDPSDLTRKTYNILKSVSQGYPQLEFHIITGFGYKYKHEIVDDITHNIYVHNDVKRVSKYLMKADLAITSQGRTIFELACMGIPSIVLAQNHRELDHIFANMANGFINLGIGKEQEEKAIQSTIEWLIKTPNVRRQMHELLLEKDFRQGRERVVQLILGEKSEDFI